MSRQALIKGVWPDKALYGSVMLFVTALVGVLYGLVDVLVGGIDYGSKVPEFLHYHAGTQAFLSLVSAALAYVALRRRATGWAFGGAVAGILSLGMLGLGTLFAVLSLVFLALSRVEGEHESAHTAMLTEEMWPDKALSASLTILVGGIVTLLWAVLVAFGAWPALYAGPEVYSSIAAVAGAVCLVAAWGLYHQKWPALGLAAGAVAVPATGIYVVGPLLGIATIVLVLKARGENEFH